MRRIGAFLCAAAMLFALPSCASVTPTVTQGFAMDTTVSFTVYGNESIGADLLKAVTDVENTLSWNVPTSAVAQLNQNGKVDNQILADTVRPLLALCEESGGEYSLLMRPLIALWNVGADNPSVPFPADIEALLPLCQGTVTVEGSTVCVPEGAQMDLGSVGKGVACDVVAEKMKQAGAVGVIGIGGSVTVCGEKPDGSAWNISVSASDDRNTSIGTLTVQEGDFVSTSGNGERYFEIDGVRYHHILSGLTGVPCDAGLNAVTVVADNGALADALSTVCFLLGEESSRDLLKNYHAQAVYQFAGGAISVTDGLTSRFTPAS